MFLRAHASELRLRLKSTYGMLQQVNGMGCSTCQVGSSTIWYCMRIMAECVSDVAEIPPSTSETRNFCTNF
ncbi:hypothetical protein L798_08017 [Zootermopsis nevadensis]|uniref:Uncharacterized protein n=1 Tax=Zootermopsis nevadensis TaxID=136037 RepID=A0A067REW0_ZOONE|nr:hypothetical protein L798_08017 [Zootermopsis nevadensis]